MKCRGRNVFKVKIDGWSKEACRHCGHDSFYLDRARQFRNDYCDCTHSYGYHFTHRKGSPRCTFHPMFEVNARVFSGELLEDVIIDISLRASCPF